MKIIMRKFINYIRSCFCKHEWELIIDNTGNNKYLNRDYIATYKVYRCKKCGHSMKYSYN